MDLRDHLQRTLGDAYSLERELGGGGMSRVFVALDRALNRRVVVKVLPHEAAGHIVVDRFKREIAIAARLQHAHVVPLLSAGEVGGLPYFTMPYVDGESLRALIARGQLPISDTVRILREIASALVYAHAQGVVHRDIKPDNVLVSGGAAMVTDFGVAKALSNSTMGERLGAATSTGVALGTPAYMAPEQAGADPLVDHRADIYAWGVVAYELLAGQPPFAGRSAQALMYAHAVERPEHIARRRQDTPPVLAELVMSCLDKTPADRPQKAADLIRALDGIMTRADRMPAGHRPLSARSRRAIGAAIGLVVIAGLTTLALRQRHGNQRAAPGSSGVDSPQVIAVLPFVNVGGDSANEAYADGIADDIRTELTKIGIPVVARGSAFSFKGKTIDPAEVGRKLHVTSFVEGTLQRSGNGLRVTAEVINVASGIATWSYHHYGEARDIFRVQDSIATSVAGELKVRLGAAQRASLANVGTTSVEAYDLYRQAEYFRERYDEPSLRKAIALYERAVAKDPKYAAPLSGMALAYAGLSEAIPPRTVFPKAKSAALQALVLDSLDATAHGVLGLVRLQYDWRPAAAEREFRRSIALDPRSVQGYIGLVWTLAQRGAIDSAIAQARAAAMADPLSQLALYWQAALFTHSNRFDSTRAVIQRLRDLDPGSVWLHPIVAWLNYRRGAYGDALREIAKGDTSSFGMVMWLAIFEARLGHRDAALGRIARLEAARKTQYVSGIFIAAGYMNLDDRAAAFRWLDVAVGERSGDLSFLWIWLWDPLRADPRFKALEAKVSSGPPL